MREFNEINTENDTTVHRKGFKLADCISKVTFTNEGNQDQLITALLKYAK